MRRLWRIMDRDNTGIITRIGTFICLLIPTRCSWSALQLSLATTYTRWSCQRTPVAIFCRSWGATWSIGKTRLGHRLFHLLVDSNMAEKGSVRFYVGPLKFRVCSGFCHRTSTLQVAASNYDYPPYYIPKSEPLLHELLPPSEEDFDALNEFIPTKTIQFMIFEPVVELQFMDHPFFEPSKAGLFKKNKVSGTNYTNCNCIFFFKKHTSTSLPNIQLQKLPKVTIECKLIEITMFNPMYLNRLVHTTCQLPDPPKKMFDACFSKVDVNVVGLCSRLFLKPNNQTTLVVPFNLVYQSKSILSPQYWVNHDVMHSEVNFHSGRW